MPEGEGPAEAPWRFDDFRSGETIGSVAIPLTPALAAQWQAVAPGTLPGTLPGPPPGAAPLAEGAALPPGLLVALTMRGYLQAVRPRPPGNVHAGLEVAWEGPAHLGETLTVAAACAGKELRRERRWVDFAVTAGVGARAVLAAQLRLLWAA